LLVFGKRAGEHAAKYAKDKSAAGLPKDQVDEAARMALAPFERTGGSEGPYQIQQDLQEMMQNFVGIVRREDEMQRALEGIGKLRDRAARAMVTGNREYNPGWHTALDLHNLLTVSEAITRSALFRKESRGGHFRDDFPEKVGQFAKVNLVVRKGADGQMQLAETPIPDMPAELKQIIEEMK
jgi:succinate dehydrogenase / fumarate reductase flavoprotein subunit